MKIQSQKAGVKEIVVWIKDALRNSAVGPIYWKSKLLKIDGKIHSVYVDSIQWAIDVGPIKWKVCANQSNGPCLQVLITQQMELVLLMDLDQQSFPQAQFQYTSFGLSDGAQWARPRS